MTAGFSGSTPRADGPPLNDMGTDIHGVFQRRTEAGWDDVTTEYKEERHYALFAWLGDVRNGFGFAGVLTHTRMEPLSSGRGFPEDFQHEDEDHRISSNAMRGRRAEYYTEEDADPGHENHLQMWMGDHSHSWLSADEILSATPPRILRTGVVDVEEYHKWDGRSAPDSWCGSISGNGVLVSDPSEVNDKTTHVRIEWFDDCAESFAYFINEVRRLKELHGDVRFVFGFDS